MKKGSILITFIILVAALLFSSAGLAQTKDEIMSWKCQSIFPSGDSLYKEFQAFAERVKGLTNGRLVITTHPVGAVVGYKEMHDALKTGVLQGYYSMPSFNSGKAPAFAALSDLPGGYENVMQFDAWFYQKGGLEFLREAQAKFGNYTVGTVFYGREHLPSKKAIRKLDDLKGMKVRAPEGIIAKLFTALGASTVSLPGSEVYSALDKGVIEAADWGTRSMNHKMGLHEVCKYSIEPGFHSMSALEFAVSKRAWDRLPKDIQQILEVTTRQWSWNAVSRLMKEDAEVGKDLEKLGVKIIALSDDDYRKIREVSQGLWLEMGKVNELSKRVVDSHIAWCKELGLLK